MRIDAEARRIDIAIRGAIELASVRVGGPRPLGDLRARWGAEVHRRYRSVHEAMGAEGEVGVQLERRHDDWTVLLHGRADIVTTTDEGMVVDEVKSTLGHEDGADAESLLGRDALRDASRQARLYALALEEAHEAAIAVAARVVVVGVDEQPAPLAILDVGYERGGAEALLVELLDVVVARAEAALQTADRRRAVSGRLRFPHARPRPHQEELMAIVAEALDAGRPALVEAPTGIGKTVAALLPAMRFALSNGAACFFATAKTTQREGVALAFTTIVDASGPDVPLTALTLRRRDQMCPPGHLRCHPDTCDLLSDFEERRIATGAVEQLRSSGSHIDPDTVFALGREHALCPFELLRRLEMDADLVIGDYNHRYDRAAFGLDPSTVVVVDEAHNLVDRTRDAASPFVGGRSIEAAGRSATHHPDPDVRQAVSALTSALRRLVDEALREAVGDGERVPIDGCLEHAIEHGRVRQLSLEAEAVGLVWLRARHRHPDAIPFPDPVVELVESVRHLTRQLRRAPRSGGRLVSFVAGVTGRSGAGVGVQCVDPSDELEPHHRAALGTVAMSATLSPASYYAELLGLSRLDPMTTSVPSPFPPEHRAVLTVPSIDTTYERREDELPRVAELIERIVAVRPGHYAAFFPSHAVLDATRRHLTLPKHQLLIQPPLAPAAMRARILRTLRDDPSPRLLLAVTGGVFAEGVDLPGEALVGAIVVGPTLPPPTFARLLIQRHFDERQDIYDQDAETGGGFAYAYVYPGLRRVVQAAGRVIRTPDDRGIIVLIGRRFATPPYLDTLPTDWYHHDPRELATEAPIERLEQFWTQCGPGRKYGFGAGP